MSTTSTAEINGLFQKLQAGPEWVLGQHWRPEPEADFFGSTVRFGRDATGLLVHGELRDADVRSSAAPFNDRVWVLGDAFEIFIEFPDGIHYVELHVGPDAQRLQLAFADGDIERMRNGQGKLADFMVGTPDFFVVQTWRVDDGWRVLARIPFASIGISAAEAAAPPPVRVSISRYDYTGGRENPVISSSSPHEVANFHRRQEWRQLDVGALPLVR